MADPLIDVAADLQRRGEPFVLATVVRCEAPTSAKPGAKALVHADGRVEGWVGGACAEPVLIREALKALRDGRPRLVGLYGEAGRQPGRTEGILDYAMTCHSGGTLEIYVEPYLPTPMLVLVGHGPVIDALETLGRAASYSLVPLRDASAWARLETLDLGRRASVVVATHADSDEDALARVLRSEAGYVSLVASRKRTTSILGRLSQRGVAADRLGRLKAPAGLDLGAVTPVEIAISILAEIVQHHRSDKTVEAEAPSDTATPTEAIDPICGMSVEIASARYRSDVAGRTTYFCCLHCKETFDGDPGRYLAAR
ncbi:MAG: XdhC family protein [Candidatus Rokuibacteriota bacterium]|jgi:xanthine dehydrogenase accessory factor